MKNLMEVMRAEALRKFTQHRRRRKESLRVRMLILQLKGKEQGLERKERLV